MVKKRIIGFITIVNNWAVQSIGYSKYLPLGKPENIIENLNRWSIDEIIINCPDRSMNKSGPNYEVIKSIVKLGISTPLVYSGGIRNLEDVIKILKLGTDRICIDSLAKNNYEECKKICRAVGTQAVIAALPLSVKNEALFYYDYIKKEEKKISSLIIEKTLSDWASEILVIDWRNEGKEASFDNQIIEKIGIKEKKLIAFGGITTVRQIHQLLDMGHVSAIAIGNSLNYTEHALYHLKKSLNRNDIRSTTW